MTGVVESLNSAVPAYQPTSANSAASAASQQQQQGGMGVAVQGAGQQQQQGANPAQSNLPMALKAKDEILTSLHLIKDIRRLEKYQRDFFLKVKESLNHVQQLLDHQLVDMAWSDNLIDCEESLLRASVTLSASAPAQIQELYALLLQDRDRLNTRFQELSVKSSLSEYVVNSRSLLDIQTVHVATEAILRNEKPIQPKSDKAIPVDHTFFLANFCTTSVASSMFASCLPGAVNNVTSANKLAVSNASPGPYGGRYGDQSPMKANVLAANTSPRQGSSVQGPQNAKMYNAYNGNGGQSGGQYMEQAKRNASGGLPPPVQGQGAGQDDPFGGHELVAAISQITRREDTPNAVGANNATTPKKGQAPPTAASPRKADIWGAKEDGEAELNGFPGGKATPPVGTNPGNGQGNSNTEALASSAAQAVIMGDGSSESVTSESDDGRFAAQAGGGNPADFDASKPLSFARIASLNLEKQAVQRSAAAAAAAAVGNAVSANPGPILQPPQQQAPQQQQQQQQPQQQMQQQQQQQHPAPIQPQQQQQQSMGMPPVGGFGAPMLGNNGNGNGSLQQQLPSTPNLSSMPPNMQQGNAQMMGGNSMASVLAQQQQMMSMGLVAPQPQQMAQMPLINLPPTNNPRYFFDIVMEGKSLGRVIIEVEPAMAPKMAQNFGMLVTASRGFGYKGCQFFQAWKGESVICGDWEHNSGRGGRAALEGGPLFTPDETRLPCIRGAVGMRRMSKKHSSLNQVASQFRIILANMNTQFTGIFGHVVSGIEALDKVANIGGEGGRPEKIAAVSQCGIWKSS